MEFSFYFLLIIICLPNVSEGVIGGKLSYTLARRSLSVGVFKLDLPAPFLPTDFFESCYCWGEREYSFGNVCSQFTTTHIGLKCTSSRQSNDCCWILNTDLRLCTWHCNTFPPEVIFSFYPSISSVLSRRKFVAWRCRQLRVRGCTKKEGKQVELIVFLSLPSFITAHPFGCIWIAAAVYSALPLWQRSQFVFFNQLVSATFSLFSFLVALE